MDKPKCYHCETEAEWQEVFFHRYKQEKAELLFAGWYCPKCRFFLLLEEDE